MSFRSPLYLLGFSVFGAPSIFVAPSISAYSGIVDMERKEEIYYKTMRASGGSLVPVDGPLKQRRNSIYEEWFD